MIVQWTCRFIKNDDHAETTGHRNHCRFYNIEKEIVIND